MINKPILFFPSQKDLRKWFEKNHKKEKELFVGFYKVSTGKLTVSWSQSFDEAICFGWIDETRRSLCGWFAGREKIGWLVKVIINSVEFHMLLC